MIEIKVKKAYDCFFWIEYKEKYHDKAMIAFQNSYLPKSLKSDVLNKTVTEYLAKNIDENSLNNIFKSIPVFSDSTETNKGFLCPMVSLEDIHYNKKSGAMIAFFLIETHLGTKRYRKNKIQKIDLVQCDNYEAIEKIVDVMISLLQKVYQNINYYTS